jgi:hypothetical protein
MQVKVVVTRTAETIIVKAVIVVNAVITIEAIVAVIAAAVPVPVAAIMMHLTDVTA